jgi:hypothetical protein
MTSARLSLIPLWEEVGNLALNTKYTTPPLLAIAMDTMLALQATLYIERGLVQRCIGGTGTCYLPILLFMLFSMERMVWLQVIQRICHLKWQILAMLSSVLMRWITSLMLLKLLNYLLL